MPVSAERLGRAVALANVPTLVAVLYQLTGERRWLGDRYRPTRSRGMDANDSGGLPDEVQDEIRSAAVDAIRAWDGGSEPAVPAPTGAALIELLSVVMGEEVPADFEPMMAEALGFRSIVTQPVKARHDRVVSVVVIGAGMSGLLASLRLREAGIDCVVLEKNDDVGGTWLENRYPGAGVDTPSYLYSYSFYPRSWSTHFAKRDEVEDYLRDFADHFDLRPTIRFGVEVTSAVYDEATQHWRVTTAEGDMITANAVISAVGQLNRPKVPDLPGLDTFEGRIFHSACWPADLDVTGRTVIVIGTGASAMQIVPAIAADVATLTVFQRSPQWVAFSDDYFRPVGPDIHWLMTQVPFYQAWYRARLAWIFNDKVHTSLQVDPGWREPKRSVNAINDAHRRVFTAYLADQLDGRDDLVAKSLPDYPPFGKRMLLDNGWFAALRRDNVELITEAVAEITPTGVRTAGGLERPAEVIVLATGFHAQKLLYPIEIRGRSGRTLQERWGDDDARAYLGITVPDFPNLFLAVGPNTVLGHGGSTITMAEFQVRYMVDVLVTMLERDLGAVECRAEVETEYNRRVDDAHAHMVWTHPGMTNWYRNAEGRVTCTLPWRIVDYRAMTETVDLGDFVTEPARIPGVIRRGAPQTSHAPRRS